MDICPLIYTIFYVSDIKVNGTTRLFQSEWGRLSEREATLSRSFPQNANDTKCLVLSAKASFSFCLHQSILFSNSET